MGSREATMEQLDAMQEPILRERAQKDQEKDYLERVRKRAQDRAREILGEAYTERQRILDEARNDADAIRKEQIGQRDAILGEAQKLKNEAEQALTEARAVRDEAFTIRENAQREGYEAGIQKADQELREFRADMGHEMAYILRSIESQVSAITRFWRNDLAELVRQSVSSATGWVLDSAHEAVVKTLVLQAINLLEEREIVSLRVNPEDESIVSDLYAAAREKAPELRQWIVQGDPSIERGGLVAESGSGSVDLRRENFRELVDGILEHLTLPQRESEKEEARELHENIEKKALSLAKKADAEIEKEAEKPLPEPSLASPKLIEKEAEGKSPEARTPEVRQKEEEPKEENAPKEEKAEPQQRATLLEDLNKEDESQEDLPEIPDDIFQVDAQDVQNQSPKDIDPEDPSLAELEEELFPVHPDASSEVLAHGGFLPGEK